MPKTGPHAMQRAYKEQREEAIQASLVKKEGPASEFLQTFAPTPFRDLHKKHRKFLARKEGWGTLWHLIGFREHWVRPLEDWKPKGKAIETVLRSLIDHLLCQYPMPAFWFEVWFRRGLRGYAPEDNPDLSSCTQFVKLAQGTGLHKLIQDGEFPVKFTKKQAHAFMQQRGVITVTQAVRWTQVQSFGGDRRLAETLCKTDWGEGLREEAFRAPVIQWFCNQAMIDPAQVGPLLDYIQHAKNQGNFVMKGRTARSLMRDMGEWHKELAVADRVANRQNREAQRATWVERRSPPPEKFEPSGIRNWETSRKTKDNRTGKQIQVRYSITELLTYQALHDEGRQLHHCAASYAWSVGKGQKSIWSFSIGREKQVTIEVRNPTKTVVQIRGTRNRMPTASEITYIQKWASENGLILTNRAVARGW